MILWLLKLDIKMISLIRGACSFGSFQDPTFITGLTGNPHSKELFALYVQVIVDRSARESHRILNINIELD